MLIFRTHTFEQLIGASALPIRKLIEAGLWPEAVMLALGEEDLKLAVALWERFAPEDAEQREQFLTDVDRPILDQPMTPRALRCTKLAPGATWRVGMEALGQFVEGALDLRQLWGEYMFERFSRPWKRGALDDVRAPRDVRNCMGLARNATWAAVHRAWTGDEETKPNGRDHAVLTYDFVSCG